MSWLDDLLKDSEESQLAWDSNKFKKPVDFVLQDKWAPSVPVDSSEPEVLDPRQEVARRDMVMNFLNRPAERTIADVPKNENGGSRPGKDVSKMVSDSITNRLNSRRMDQQELMGAQSAANNNQLIAGLGRAFNQVGAGIAGAKTPETPVYDSIDRNSNVALDQLGIAQKMRSGWEAERSPQVAGARS